MVGKEKDKDIINTSKQLLNLLFLSALIVIPTIFGFLKMPTEMGISIGGIAVALFFINLDKFKRFKGAGIEAEMQEAMTKTYAALEQLKELALTLTSPIVDTLALAGKTGQFIHLKYKLENVAQIKEALQKLGASEAEIEEACTTMDVRVISDHIKRILNYLKIVNPDKADAFQGYDSWNIYEWDKAKVDSFIRDHSLEINGEAKECLADLDYYLAKKKLRREDKWQM